MDGKEFAWAEGVCMARSPLFDPWDFHIPISVWQYREIWMFLIRIQSSSGIKGSLVIWFVSKRTHRFCEIQDSCIYFALYRIENLAREYGHHTFFVLLNLPRTYQFVIVAVLTSLVCQKMASCCGLCWCYVGLCSCWWHVTNTLQITIRNDFFSSAVWLNLSWLGVMFEDNSNINRLQGPPHAACAVNNCCARKRSAATVFC